MLYLALTRLHIGTRMKRTEFAGIRQCCSNQGALVTEKILRFLVEMILSHSRSISWVSLCSSWLRAACFADERFSLDNVVSSL